MPRPTAIPLLLALLTLGTARAGDGVILLHGLARASTSMAKIERSLTAEGYTVLNLDYPSRKHTIGQLSKSTLHPAFIHPRLRHCKRIHIVTHSMGGIIVRHYLKNRRPARLGRVVMLAPPNQGSEVVDRIGCWRSFRWINGPAGQQLGTGRNSLPKQLPPANFELGIIAGCRSINWINSSMIPGVDDGKVSVTSTRLKGTRAHLVVKSSHPFIMRHPAAIRATLAFLQTGSFRQNRGAAAK